MEINDGKFVQQGEMLGEEAMEAIRELIKDENALLIEDARAHKQATGHSVIIGNNFVSCNNCGYYKVVAGSAPARLINYSR